MLQQSQRLRREPNTTTRQEPRKSGQHAQALSSDALPQQKTKTFGTLGPASNTRSGTNMKKAQRLTPRQDHHPPTTYAQPHRMQRRASAVLQPTKLRTRSVIGSHGALRRHIHGMFVVILMQANHVSVLPNNSFKLSPNGMSRWPPSAGPAAHFALAVQLATPSVPA